MNLNARTFLLALSFALFAGSSQAQACDNPKVIRLSLIPLKNAASQAAEFRPLVNALEASLKRPVELVLAPSYGAVVEGLLAANIELAELGPASYAQAKARDAGITAFASLIQRVGLHTDSSDSYRSLLIVRRDKHFNGLASLRDSSVSLVDPASTSGALIPRQAISTLTGMPFERYFGRITFAGSHDRAIQAVQKGFVDAAFVSSSRLDEALRTGSVRPDEMVVQWKSSPIPYDPFVYRGRLCQPVIDKIKQAFFQNSASLQGMLRSMNAEGFNPVSDDKYREIRDIYASQP
jgi:phosphonate transport system substrate-binding protein